MSRKYYDQRFEKVYDMSTSGRCLNDLKTGIGNCTAGETETMSEGKGNQGNQLPKIFVRYEEGAELYSMSVHTFMRLSADAKAVYKVNRVSLVNTKIFEEYLESFRVY